VREVGRDSGPGNAILYGTTRTFLEKFGLKSLKDLPPLEDFAPDEKSREYIRARLSVGESATDVYYGDDDEDRSHRTVSLDDTVHAVEAEDDAPKAPGTDNSTDEDLELID